MDGEEEEKIVLVPLHQIVPLPYNVCTMDTDTDLMLKTDMTRIETKGRKKIDPILLRRLTPEEIEEYKKKGNPSAQYMIIDGHSRWEAARELGWHEIRAIITDMTLDEAREFNYKKNKVRGTVDPLREAAYFRYLLDVKKMTVDQIAEKFGISHRRVDQILSRIKGAEPLKKILRESAFPLTKVEPWHYEIVGAVEEPEKREKLAELLIKEELSGREAQIAKEAIEKGLPPEKTVHVVKAVKREKLAPKEVKKVIQAVAVKPEIADEIIKLPKEKIVEEAEKIISPPPPPKPPEEIAHEKAMQLTQYYPATMIGYIYQRYKGANFQDVLKATTWLLWNKTTEEEKEKIVEEAIRLGAAGFKEPIHG
ncbi:MAG: ParB/RepB/Spo0J family partition protein [Candidatus Bathyarchaeia archaeon]